MKDEYKEMVCRVRFIDGVPAKTYLSDVEIVRCKDCKHHKGHNCDRLYGFQDAFTFLDDDFCSWAKRKENDNQG